MKKLIGGLGLLVIILAGGCIGLLAQADAGNAPQEDVIVDLTDRIKN